MTRANEAVLKKAAKWDTRQSGRQVETRKSQEEQDEETLKEKVSRRKRK